MYNTSDHEVSAESILLNHGGVQDKDLVKLVNSDSGNDNDDNEMDTMSSLPYFCLAAYLTNWSILIILWDLKFECGELVSKVQLSSNFTGILFITKYTFPCNMYSWISDDSMLHLLQLDWYNIFHVKATSSTHGGVVTYVDDSYDATIKP